MSGPQPPESPGSSGAPEASPEVGPEGGPEVGPELAARDPDASEIPEGVDPAYAETYRAAYAAALAAEQERQRIRAEREPWWTRARATWLAPAGLAVLLVVLIAGVFVLARGVAGGVSQSADSHGTPTLIMHATSTPTGSLGVRSHPRATRTRVSAPRRPKPRASRPWSGTVTAVQPTGVTVGCTAPDGVDAAGQPVSYAAANMIDDLSDTAWRCDGPGIGQRVSITLAAATRVAEVGLIPGYAKTDPDSGANRYAENNRIIEARWIVGGRSFVQHLDGSAGDRALQTLRIPPTVASEVGLQILAVTHGPRDTTAISQVSISAVG